MLYEYDTPRSLGHRSLLDALDTLDGRDLGLAAGLVVAGAGLAGGDVSA
jgi:hypothetical protein